MLLQDTTLLNTWFRLYSNRLPSYHVSCVPRNNLEGKNLIRLARNCHHNQWIAVSPIPLSLWVEFTQKLLFQQKRNRKNLGQFPTLRNCWCHKTCRQNCDKAPTSVVLQNWERNYETSKDMFIVFNFCNSAFASLAWYNWWFTCSSFWRTCSVWHSAFSYSSNNWTSTAI